MHVEATALRPQAFQRKREPARSSKRSLVAAAVACVAVLLFVQ
jgi:hypothetical protein